MAIVPHWSASKFMTWDQCPGEFKARYVDGRPLQVTEAMEFGQAIHRGLEAHYRGEDGVRVFRAYWKQASLDLGGNVDASLTGRGLDLLEQVFELKLSGVPERGFEIDTNRELGAPIVGFVDLWGNDGVTYDFKTTRGAWSQQRAQKELWQPVLYTWARWEEEPEFPGGFEYIVMDRSTGQLQRFRREWDADEINAQMNAAWLRMRTIADLVRADWFECHGKHGLCYECGDRWNHDHACVPEQHMERIRLHAH